jgi:hypothetical protein
MDQIVYLILGGSVTLGVVSLMLVNNALKGNSNRGRH